MFSPFFSFQPSWYNMRYEYLIHYHTDNMGLPTTVSSPRNCSTQNLYIYGNIDRLKNLVSNIFKMIVQNVFPYSS